MAVGKSRQHDLYSSIFIKLTLLLIFIVLLSGISLSFYYSRVYLDDYKERDYEELSVIKSYYQNFLNSVRASGSVIITDQRIQRLIYDDELVSWEISNILMDTKNLLASSPYIEFINFYIPEENYYFSTYTGQKESGNLLESIDPDYEIFYGVDDFSPIPMTVKLDMTNDLVTIYSDMLVFFLPLSRQENSPYLAIFIDAEKFRKLYQKETESEIIILNYYEEVICHTALDVFGIKKHNLQIAEILDETISSNGKIYINRNRRDLSILTAIKEDNYVIFKNSSIMPFVKSVRIVFINSFILIFIIVVVVYFLSSVLFKKLYSPIQSLLSKLHEVDRFKAEEKSDLDIINFLNIEAESVSEIDTLRNFREQNKIMVRNRSLDQFLSGQISLESPESIDDFMQRIEYSFDRFNYFKIVTCSFKKDFENYYTTLLRRGFIQQYFSRDYNVISCIDKKNNIITIISSKSLIEDHDLYLYCEGFIDFLQTEQVQIAEQLRFLSISEQCRGFMNLPEYYNGVEDINNSSYKYAFQKILTIDFIMKDKNLPAEYPLRLEEKILKSLKNHNCTESLEFLNEFFIVLENFDHISIFNFIIRFISSFISTLQMIERKSRISFEINYNSWFKEVIEAESMKVAENYIRELILAVQVKYSQYKKSKSENYGKAVKAIIDEQYKDPNLCINFIADSIKLSPAYCGQIFRKTYSVSIIEYLLTLRLEKAKDIIDREPDRKINDVSCEVGILNYRYFYTKFKQAYGVTPGNYRMRNKGKAGSQI